MAGEAGGTLAVTPALGAVLAIRAEVAVPGLAFGPILICTAAILVFVAAVFLPLSVIARSVALLHG